MAVEDIHLDPVEPPRTVVRRGHHGDPGLVPAAVLLGEGQRGPGLARGDAPEVGLLGRFIAGVHQRVGGQHGGGEVRRAEQCPTHLLEHDHLLHAGEPLAAVGLGDRQGGEAHLLGHLGPDIGVEAALGVHLVAHRGLGRLLLEEAANELSELLLLVGECEVHVGLSCGSNVAAKLSGCLRYSATP